MPVRMIAIEQPRQCALGQRRRVIAQLLQALEAELANALDIRLREIGIDHHLGEQRHRGIQESRDRRQRHDSRVRADIDVEIGAQTREGVRDLQRRTSGAALVQEVGGERRQPRAICRIGRRAARHEQHGGDDRHVAMRDCAQLETVRQHAAVNARKTERRARPGGGQLRSIDPTHETWTSSDPGSASSRSPRGTTLSATRGASTNPAADGGGDGGGRRLLVAAAVGAKVTRGRRETRCTRSADRTCRRSRQSSAGDRRTARRSARAHVPDPLPVGTVDASSSSVSTISALSSPSGTPGAAVVAI